MELTAILAPSQIRHSSTRKDVILGQPVELACNVGWLTDEIAGLLDPFQTGVIARTARGQVVSNRFPITGSVRAYDEDEVLKHVSTVANRVPNTRPGMSPVIELYQDEERFWLVDDQWGMAEVNLLKKSWRSWVLPHPTADLQRCAEWTVMWPLAQLLSGPGLAVLPAISIQKDGWGAIIFSPFKMDGELAALSRDGFEVIAQSWHCLQEEQGQVQIFTHSKGDEVRQSSRCNAVIMVESGRRAVSRVDELPGHLALEALQRHWPIAALHRSRRQVLLTLAANARCCSVQLARQPEDLLKLIRSLNPER